MSTSKTPPTQHAPPPVARQDAQRSSMDAQASGTGGPSRSQRLPPPSTAIAAAIYEAHGFELAQPPGDVDDTSTPILAHARTDDPVAVKHRLGQYTNAHSERHVDNLKIALTRHGSVDVAKAQRNLRALVEENNARCKQPPTTSHLYVGFGPIGDDNKQAVSATAKQLRVAAATLWPLLKEPQDRHMLDWIAHDWQVYERLCQSTGARAAMRRPVQGPDIRPVSEWSTNAPSTPGDLTDPEVILQRATWLVELTRALTKGDNNAIAASLKNIPAHVGHFDPFFPPVQIDSRLNPYATWVKAAIRYDEAFESAASHRLLQFMEDGNRRREAMARVNSDQRAWSEEERNQTYDPDVRNLCVELRETEIGALKDKSAQHLSALIQSALACDDLEEQLTLQPYASLNTMLIKCTVLQGHVNTKDIEVLRAALKNARESQTHVSAHLRRLLLDDELDHQEIAALAMIEYAKQMTSLPVDYLSAGASWSEVRTMGRNIHAVHERYLKSGDKDTHGPVAALGWLKEQIRLTESQAH